MDEIIKQQLSYPLDPVSQRIVEEVVRQYFRMGFKAPSYTTTERDNLTPTAGLIIFNSTTSKLNFYNGSAWAAVTSA